MQASNPNAPVKYKGPIDCAKQLYREGGLRSVYRGSMATLCRDVPASGVYFCTYEWLKNVLTPAGKEKGQLTIGATLCAGGNWSIANNRLTSQLITQSANSFSSFRLCWHFKLGRCNTAGRAQVPTADRTGGQVPEWHTQCVQAVDQRGGHHGTISRLHPGLSPSFPSECCMVITICQVDSIGL